jgi:hypothetical protein
MILYPDDTPYCILLIVMIVKAIIHIKSLKGVLEFVSSDKLLERNNILTSTYARWIQLSICHRLIISSYTLQFCAGSSSGCLHINLGVLHLLES